MLWENTSSGFSVPGSKKVLTNTDMPRHSDFSWGIHERHPFYTCKTHHGKEEKKWTAEDMFAELLKTSNSGV
ncbi:unnamed protein product [Caretta caretta]